MTKANILDRAISWVAPAAGARRIRQRTALDILQRGYDGAAKGRLTSGWHVHGTSADAEVGKAAPMLRDRMRDLVRNNPHAANALHVLVTHAVGAGIVPRSKDKKLNELFAEWAKSCDADGHLHFYGIQALAVREMLESGDGLVRRRRRLLSDGLPVPLQLQVLEPDQIDSTKQGDLGQGRSAVQGIEYDGIGKRTAYWMFAAHPGNSYWNASTSMTSRPIPASDIAHVFEKQRTQVRGTPWGTPAIRDLQNLGEYEHSELIRKRTESCMVGVVTGGDGDDAVGLPIDGDDVPGIRDSDGNIVERFEPGMFYHAVGGKDIKFHQPTATTGYDSYKTASLHTIAAGFRVPYFLLSGRLDKVNYSSSKVGLEAFKKTVEALQWNFIIPMLCQPLWDWFCEAAYFAGKIKTPTVPVVWTPPRFPSADEQKDIAARNAAIRSGLKNPLEAIAETGYTAEEVLAGYIEWNALLDKHGLIFDSDPRKMSQAGQTQVEPGPDPTPGDGDDET